MKKLSLIVAMISLAGFASADWKQSVSDGFNDAVDFTKETYSDVKDSVTGDKKKKESQFINVSSLLAFEQNVEFSVTKVEKLENNQYEINVGLKNLAVKPTRLVDVYKDREILLLDKDGFAYPLTANLVNGKNDREIIIPKDAGVRAKWIFNNVEAKPTSVRIYGKDFLINP